jgi:hypothetical protein
MGGVVVLGVVLPAVVVGVVVGVVVIADLPDRRWG